MWQTVVRSIFRNLWHWWQAPDLHVILDSILRTSSLSKLEHEDDAVNGVRASSAIWTFWCLSNSRGRNVETISYWSSGHRTKLLFIEHSSALFLYQLWKETRSIPKLLWTLERNETSQTPQVAFQSKKIWRP